MTKTRTTQVRIYSDLNKELRVKFPRVRSADLIQMMYNTSLLRLEAGLRDKKKKNR